MLTGQLKARCIRVLQDFVSDFQEVCRPLTSFHQFSSAWHVPQRKGKVTDADVDAFMNATRKIEPTFGKRDHPDSAL